MLELSAADVFVVGGGPAGLAAAIAARRKGFSVIVADGAAPPIDKPCGEGALPETQAALRDLGVEVPAGTGYRFRGFQFIQDNIKASADFTAGQGIGIRRPLLHRLLLEKAEEYGVRFLWKTPVRGIGSNGVQLSNHTVRTRWIIGADGGGSRVRRWGGLEAAIRRQQRSASRRHYRVRPWTEYVEIHWGSTAQAYVTPVADEEVCVVLLGETPEDTDFDRTLADMPELRERLATAELSSRERGALTAMHALRRVSCGNVALVGDASGGVDAITGEGLRLAFRQALALADAMEAGDLCEYEKAHIKLARRPTYMGMLLLQLGRNAGIRKRVLGILQRHSELFARLLEVHTGHATPGDLVITGAEFSWQFLAA